MPSRERPPSAAHPRPFCHAGLLWDDFDPDSAWLRETAVLRFRKPAGPAQFTLVGRRRAHPELRGLERGQPGLRVRVNGKPAAELPPGAPGDWSLPLALPTGEEIELTLELTGNSLTNALAWAGRVTGLPAGQRFRAQRRNRQLRLLALRAADGAAVCDFGRPAAVFAATTSNVPPTPITKSTPNCAFQRLMKFSLRGDVIATNSNRAPERRIASTTACSSFQK
jgi:hypothetical protein